MTQDKILILKVSKNKYNQKRVTIPKALQSDYVEVKPIDINIFKNKKRYFR